MRSRAGRPGRVGTSGRKGGRELAKTFVNWTVGPMYPQEETKRRKQKPATVRILVLVGGTHHDGPEIRKTLEGFLGTRDGFEVTLSDDLRVLSQENLAGYDVIVNTTTDRQPADEQCYALLNAVAGGKGFIAIHGGTATFWNSPAYFAMIGGKMVGKSPKPRHEYSVKLLGGKRVEDHPITMGVADYDVNDELFVVEGDQTQWHVLARSTGHPSMWTKTFYMGRVFVTTLGHDAGELSRPTFQALVLNAVEWVCGLS